MQDRRLLETRINRRTIALERYRQERPDRTAERQQLVAGERCHAHGSDRLRQTPDTDLRVGTTIAKASNMDEAPISHHAQTTLRDTVRHHPGPHLRIEGLADRLCERAGMRACEK